MSRFLVDNGNAVLTPMTDGYIPGAPYSSNDYEEDDDSKVSEKETSKKDETDKDDGWKGTRYYKDGTMLRPDRPILRRGLSITNATRAM